MAFRRKAEFILTEKPDILIVPECENKEHLSFDLFTKQPSDIFWYGDNPHKGIGIFTFNSFEIKVLDFHNPDFKYVLPLSIFNDKIKDEGFNPRSVLSAFAKKGLIETSEESGKVRNDIRKYVNKTQTRCISLKMESGDYDTELPY